MTLPAIYYAEAHPGDADIRAFPEGGWTDQERVARLVTAIRNSDAIEQALSEATAHVDKALEALVAFDEGVERTALEELATYIVNRNM